MAFPDSQDTSHPDEADGDSAIAVQDAIPKTGEPPKYAVVLLNDDFTTMEFVMLVLQKYFRKTHEEAHRIMLKIHHDGRGVAGIYSYEIAETKADQVVKHARAKDYPLQCIVEPIETGKSP